MINNYKGKIDIIRKIICFIGQNSLGIYFVHIIVTKIMHNYFIFNSLIGTLVYGFVILSISAFLVYGISKIPILRKIIKM